MAGRADTWIGRVVGGRYEVLAPVARGGAGAVYRAVQRPIGREVALKVLRGDLDDASFRVIKDRFLREAELASKLRHPNIVTYLDAGEDADGTPFVVMELLRGRTLKDAIKDGPLTNAEAARLCAGIARGLQHAHGRGIIHRDIKPANVFLIPDDQGIEHPVLVDFGLVKDAEALDATRTTLTMGTPPYMAPEQVDAGDAGPWTDVYALGVVLFRVLTGKLPFTGGSAMRIALAHLQEDIPEMSSKAPDVHVHPELEVLTRRCLAKEGASRPTAEQVGDLLEMWFAEKAPTRTMSPVERQALEAKAKAEAKEGRTRVAAIGAMVAGAGAVGLVALLGTQGGPAEVAEAPPAALDLTASDEELVEAGVEAPAPGSPAAMGEGRPEVVREPVQAAAEAQKSASGSEDTPAQAELPKDPPEAAKVAVPKPKPKPDPKPEATPKAEPKAAPKPAPAAAPAAAPSKVVVDGITFTAAHGQRVLDLVNKGSAEDLIKAGVYEDGVHKLIEARPFESVVAIGDLAGIGPGTMRALAARTADDPSRFREVPKEDEYVNGLLYVDNVPFTKEHADKALAWINGSPREVLVASGVYEAGVTVLIDRRPFPSLSAVGATPLIGEKTVRQIFDATKP